MPRPLRVLIVEDVPDDADLLVHVLKQAGYDPDTLRVDTAPALRSALGSRTWDIILSDNSLPQFNALGALELVRGLGLDLPFIVISGSIGEDVAVALMKAGAHDYLFKGSLARLGVAVDRELREAVLRRERRSLDERLELISKASSDVVYDFDIDSGSIWWNENLLTVFGYADSEPVHTVDWFEANIHEEDLPAVRDSFHAALTADADAWTGEYRFRRGDGSYAFVLDRGYIVHDESRCPVRRVGAMLDITDRKQLEQQFLHAQKMEAVGRLAGGVAHDFNNILTVITSMAYVMLDELQPDDPMREDIDVVRLAAERAATLTRQLLAFSRKQVLVPAVLDLNTVIANFEGMIGRLVGEHIRVTTRLAPDLAHVKADPGQLEQVLMNLVVNAKDAMPRGGGLTIETANIDLNSEFAHHHTTMKPGRYVTFSVTDTGTGMDEATQGRLFEPFFTTKGQGKGTGLGLATVYGIVNQSGGQVDVFSRLGGGSMFRVYLPRVDESAPAVSAEGEVARTAGGQETILLVEDDQAVRSVSERILRQAGYRVMVACDGLEALEIAHRHANEVRLVITDVVMPNMSGRELVRRLNATGDVPVIFASGYTDDAILQQGEIDPGVYFVQKPFAPAVLLAKVREVLDSAAVNHETTSG